MGKQISYEGLEIDLDGNYFLIQLSENQDSKDEIRAEGKTVFVVVEDDSTMIGRFRTGSMNEQAPENGFVLSIGPEASITSKQGDQVMFLKNAAKTMPFKTPTGKRILILTSDSVQGTILNREIRK